MSERVGLLGVGLMGSAMGRRLLAQGMEVVAWDRDAEHLEPLREAGAEAARAPAEVLSGTRTVITMLPDAEVVLEVVGPLLDQWPAGTVWLQMSSVGATEADRLTQIAAARGVALVDAPVSGSTDPAEEGKLTVLASGPDFSREAVKPVLEALGSRVEWVGEAGAGSRLKLAANHWMIVSVAALAETMQLCQAMGLDQRQFIALLDGGPLGSRYGLDKLAEMRSHQYPAGFPVRLAPKDLQLVGEVASSRRVPAPVLEAVRRLFQATAQAHADEDLAAVYELPAVAE